MRRTTGELADLAEKAAADAERLLANAKRTLRQTRSKAADRQADGEHDAAAGRRRGRLARAVNDLQNLLAATRQIAAQTRQRLAGQTPDGATRRVSLHDPDARPIAKGRLGKPVEFGHKAQLVEGDEGVIVDHRVERGNPPDASASRPRRGPGQPAGRPGAPQGHRRPRLRREERRRRAARPRRDRRGHPAQGQTLRGPPAAEHRPAFRRTVKWRTGVEGRISTLKRGYGWDRTRIDGTESAKIWIGHGVLAHNLVKISTLAA